ncbi:MAG TPA: ABC transporter ATP-binding protein [Acidimicrobiales bacterium]|nr:ABC transporter ATP-binding protein [Acidimicrobiales bacterium]
MGDDSTLFPSASTKSTLAYCWKQCETQRRGLIACWILATVGTITNSVAGPVVFAALLTRIATLPAHAALWKTFGPLVIAYGVVLFVGMIVWRLAGWIEWGSSLRAFAYAITNGYNHLVSLSHRWHTDRPAGEVISTLESFSWSFIDMIDVFTWGFIRIGVSLLCAIGVLAFYAWPVALVMIGLTAVFAVVLTTRMAKVTSAAKAFNEAHTKATGVIADTISNLTTVRSQSAETLEKGNVSDLVAESVAADLKARRVFATTRLQMESSLASFSWIAVGVGVILALHHTVAAGAVYLILFYATQVVQSLEDSFEDIRTVARCLGRCAKFVGIAETIPEIRDVPEAADLVVSDGSVDFAEVSFGYKGNTSLFEDLTLSVRPGEHVGLVGPSGSGKTTLTKLLLRFMDVQQGAILIDGADISKVSQGSLRRNISYVPQEPQMLHRTVAENILYGMEEPGEIDYDLVEKVGRAAHVEEFVSRLPNRYDTVVGERGLKLSGGQRQRVAIAQAMAKDAPILVLDEATSALDSESEMLVQDALWKLMDGATALVVAHRLATIARLDRIIVVDQGRIVEQGSHQELLRAGEAGVYGRLWRHQSGGFLAA